MPRGGLVLLLALLLGGFPGPLALQAQAQAEPRRYESDAAAFPVRELAPGESFEGPYLLERESGPDRELERLFKDGVLLETTLRLVLPKGALDPAAPAEAREPPTAARLLVARHREGRLSSVSFEDEAGRVLEERRPTGEGAFITLRSSYVGERLAELVELDPAGAASGRRSYRYDTAGRLSEVRSSGSLGEERAGSVPAPSGSRFAPYRPGSAAHGGGLLASWTAQGGESQVQAMGTTGKPLLVERYSGGILVSLRREERAADGRLLSSSEEDLRSGQTERIEYDEGGRPLVKRIEGKAGLLESREYRYDAEGRLLVESLARGRLREERRLSWDPPEGGPPGSEPYAEEQYRDGRLERRILRPTATRRVEEQYDAGSLFVRVTYEDGRKRLEEFFVEGRPLRKREYP